MMCKSVGHSPEPSWTQILKKRGRKQELSKKKKKSQRLSQHYKARNRKTKGMWKKTYQKSESTKRVQKNVNKHANQIEKLDESILSVTKVGYESSGQSYESRSVRELVKLGVGGNISDCWKWFFPGAGRVGERVLGTEAIWHSTRNEYTMAFFQKMIKSNFFYLYLMFQHPWYLPATVFGPPGPGRPHVDPCSLFSDNLLAASLP